MIIRAANSYDWTARPRRCGNLRCRRLKLLKPRRLEWPYEVFNFSQQQEDGSTLTYTLPVCVQCLDRVQRALADRRQIVLNVRGA